MVPQQAHGRCACLVALWVEHPQCLPSCSVDGCCLINRCHHKQTFADFERRHLKAACPRRKAATPEIGCILFDCGEHILRRTPPLASRLGPTDPAVDRPPLPHDLELLKVAGVDLGQRGVFGAPEIAPVVAPLSVAFLCLGLRKKRGPADTASAMPADLIVFERSMIQGSRVRKVERGGANKSGGGHKYYTDASTGAGSVDLDFFPHDRSVAGGFVAHCDHHHALSLGNFKTHHQRIGALRCWHSPTFTQIEHELTIARESVALIR